MANLTTPVIVALEAAKMGFPVFPTDPATKRPFIKDWPNQATREPEAIHAFWTQFPQAMAGVVTGHASGFFVLDIDVEGREDAFAKLEDFEQTMGKLPKTMMVKTPSGGLHIYFVMPQGIDVRNSAGKLGDGFDIRANGGYVIFPGSIRADGKAYEMVNVQKVAHV